MEILFRNHYARLVGSLTLVASDHQSAEDAVQEAFAQAHIHWKRISRYDDPAAWVRRVALNRLLNVRRRLVRKRRVLQKLGAGEPVPDEINKVADHEALDDALSGLSPRQRAVLVLHYVEDLAVRDIASALGIAEGTVKTHLHRARQAMRKLIEVQ
ncbi:MAG: SigE family RNA polymerase sigma factor [Acidimicrobiia bacterium]